MNPQANLVRSRGAAVRVMIPLLGLLAAACATEDPVAGTWSQSDAVAILPPSVPVPDGTPLNIDANWQMDATAQPGTFTVGMDLEAIGLVDRIDVEGTYVAAGDELELTFTGFVLDPESINTTTTREDGTPCIVLMGFAGTEVCFPSPQTHAFATDGDTLSFTLDTVVAGDPMPADFTLTRAAP